MNAITPVTEVKNALVKMQDNFKAALPDHIPADKFIAVAQTAIVNTPSLVGLERASLYQAFMQCAQDGLLPDGRECAIVPYGGKAKYTPMVGGICKKIRNSGEVGTVDAQSVFSKDNYKAWTDEKGPHFKHTRAIGDRGDYLLTYAYALGKDGSVYFEEMPKDQMEAIKKQAMSKLPADKQKNSPWNGPFEDEMRRKSALRRLAKYRLPSSSDMSLQTVLRRDDEDEIEAEPEETTKDAQKTTSSRLGAIIEAQVEPTVEQVVEMVKEAIPEAKVVSPAPKATPKPATAQKSTGNKKIIGLPQDLTCKDGEGAKGPWRRYACKLDGNWYGTFDSKINDQIVAAVNAQQQITIEYTETVKNGNTLRNIVSVTDVAGEAEIIDDSEIPI
jgi:recombination protein RecT